MILINTLFIHGLFINDKLDSWFWLFVDRGNVVIDDVGDGRRYEIIVNINIMNSVT